MFATLLLLTVSSLTGFTQAQTRCASECKDFYRATTESEACQSQPKSLECVRDTCRAADTFDVCFPCLGFSRAEAASVRELCQNSGGGRGGVSPSGEGPSLAPSASRSLGSPVPSSKVSDCSDVCRELDRAIGQSAACDRDPKSTSCFRDLCVASSTFKACGACIGMTETEIDALERNCASVSGGGGDDNPRPSSSRDDPPFAGSSSASAPTRSSDPSSASTVPFGRADSASSTADAPSTTSAGPSPSQPPAPPGSNAQRAAFPIGGALFAMGLAALF